MLLLLFHQPLVHADPERLLESLDEIALAQVGFPGDVFEGIVVRIVALDEGPEVVDRTQDGIEKAPQFTVGVKCLHQKEEFVLLQHMVTGYLQGLHLCQQAFDLRGYGQDGYALRRVYARKHR